MKILWDTTFELFQVRLLEGMNKRVVSMPQRNIIFEYPLASIDFENFNCFNTFV